MSTTNDSMLSAVNDPVRLRDRLINLDVANVDRTRQHNGGSTAHTLGENMVRHLGFRTFSNVLDDLENQQHPMTSGGPHPIVEHPRAVLDSLVHLSETDKLRIECRDFSGLSDARRRMFEWLAERPEIVADLRIGGTDYFAHGPKGSGKTTLKTTWLARTLELNNDAYVWRGSSSRSEWLPLRKWVTLCLPAGLDVEAVLSPPSDAADPITVDIEEVVHDVIRYRNPLELNEKFVEGGLYVVYPDPQHRGCTKITREAEEIPVIEHVSPKEAYHEGLDASEITPASMWWFAWTIGTIDQSRPIPITWGADEVGNLMPEHASNDYHDLFTRIEAFRNQYVDARRNHFSMAAIGHDEDDLHNLVRKKLRWRICMNGVDNPTTKSVVGMGKPKMERNYSGQMDLGEALMWSKQSFAPFSWADIPSRFKVPGQLHIRFPEVEEVMRKC